MKLKNFFRQKKDARGKARRFSVDVASLPAMPELIGRSSILSDKQIAQLNNHLLSRAEGNPWHLAFSSNKSGFSLNNLYRSIDSYDGPALLVVSDTHQSVFGAMADQPLAIHDSFYGTGETYVFSFAADALRLYPSSGANDFYIRATHDYMGFGADSGRFALWLDGDLNHGRSQQCCTYNSTCLTAEEDFIVAAVELWTFGVPMPNKNAKNSLRPRQLASAS